MKRGRHALVAALFAALIAIGASSSAQAPTRCDQCGMHIRPDSIFRAGGARRDGTQVRFDSPKCFFRFHFAEGPIEEGWMIDRRSRSARPARSLHYLLGSDRMGPMGPDLAPVEGLAEARALAETHHASAVLSFDEVTREVVNRLFAGRARPPRDVPPR